MIASTIDILHRANIIGLEGHLSEKVMMIPHDVKITAKLSEDKESVKIYHALSMPNSLKKRDLQASGL